MKSQAPSPRTSIRRSDRAQYERQAIHEILDEGLIAHVGFTVDDQPFVIPMVYGRSGDQVYLHGSPVTRIMRRLSEGVAVSMAVTLIDGLVLARSAFHHSVNYRSVVLLGTARPVIGEDERLDALRVIVEHLVPNRWSAARTPTSKELRRTSVLALPLEEASAKIRTGPPVDDEQDYSLGVWAGEIPLVVSALGPVPDPRLDAGVQLPDHVRELVASREPPTIGSSAPGSRRSGP